MNKKFIKILYCPILYMNYFIYLFQLLVHVVVQDVVDCNLHVCSPYFCMNA
jgi:hypothetical protein